MAVPSSGALSLAGIRAELVENTYATNATNQTSLLACSNGDVSTINTGNTDRPDGSAPHAMSEFYNYDHDLSSFSDAKGVSKSITTGEANFIQIGSTGSSSPWNVTGTTAHTISFWVKAGWNSSLNTNIHLFHSNQEDSTGTRNDQVRIYYNESNNRLYIERGENNSNYHQQFWLFHANYGTYATAYAAAGLNASYWSASNRGNTGDDDFTMITFTMSGTSSAAPDHLKCYWNASTLGTGYYASGRTVGTGGSMDASQSREVSIGMNTANNLKSGNNAATVYNDLTIWNKMLSDSEVSELYNNGTRLDATTHSAASNLKGYYTFEAGNGNDSSGESSGNFTIAGDSAIFDIV
tara:strand:+ start:63 stop:1118 length:1056 start_codon:yes stop_codon:yes gene_type:complete